MDDRFKEYIDAFRKEGAKYWLFSHAERARWARCHDDIPLDIVFDATEEEAAEICAKIRKRLKRKDFHEIYVKVLVYFNDTSAVDDLEELVQHFKEKRRVFKNIGVTCSVEIGILKDAIKHLKRDSI